MRPAVVMADPAANPIAMECAGGVAVLRIDRPKALNALDPATLDALGAALDEIDADDTVRSVVITGAGERAFSAGADIATMAAMGPADGHAYSRLGHAVFSRLDDLRVPAIAAVNGVALGGGLELALACDLIVAGERARLRRGIVDRVVPDDRLADEAAALARELALRAPVALRQAKRATRAAVETDLASGLRYEVEAFATVFATDDRSEGLRAFLEKRPPRWTGR